MTTYITIPGVRKRTFVVQAFLPKLSDTPIIFANADDTRITRNGDIRITRSGDTRIAHNTSLIYPRVIGGVRKRSFKVQAKVKNG